MRLFLVVAAFGTVALYESVLGVQAISSGSWQVGSLWFAAALLTLGLLMKLWRDVRRSSTESPRRSWRALLRHVLGRA